MNKKTIQDCDDIKKLKKLCIAQYSQLSVVSSYITKYGKGETTAERTCDRIGDYLVNHQFEVEI